MKDVSTNVEWEGRRWFQKEESKKKERERGG